MSKCPLPLSSRGEGEDVWERISVIGILVIIWCLVLACLLVGREFGSYITTPVSSIAFKYSFFNTSFEIP